MRVIKEMGSANMPFRKIFNAFPKTCLSVLPTAVKLGFDDEEPDQKIGEIMEGCFASPHCHADGSEEMGIEILSMKEIRELKIIKIKYVLVCFISCDKYIMPRNFRHN